MTVAEAGSAGGSRKGYKFYPIKLPKFFVPLLIRFCL